MSQLHVESLQAAMQAHEMEKHGVTPEDYVPIPPDCVADVKVKYDALMASDNAEFFCVCTEEMCFCSNRVPGNPQACTQCARGEHKWHA
jgi:hypothetical protein